MTYQLGMALGLAGLAGALPATAAAQPASIDPARRSAATAPGRPAPSPKCLAAATGDARHVWVRQADGQLLYSKDATPLRPLPGVTGVAAVAATDIGRVLLLLDDGRVLESRDGRPLTRAPDVERAIDIAAGDKHAVALLRDGTIRAWGLPFAGMLGDGRCPFTPCEDQDRWRQTDWYRHNPGGCWCPGRGDDRMPVKVADIDNGVAVTAAPGRSFAILADGTVRGWGVDHTGDDGGGGMLGANAHAWAARPVPVVGVAGARFVMAGRKIGAAILADGRVVAWGGGLGRRIRARRYGDAVVPVPVPELTGAIALTVHHALFPDGRVQGWGRPGVPLRETGVKNAVAIVANEAIRISYAALLADGQVIMWGHSSDYPNGPVTLGQVDSRTVRECAVPGTTLVDR